MDENTLPHLRHILPRAGFVWPAPAQQTHLLGTRRRDTRVVAALAQAFGVLQGEQVEGALAAMFDTAKHQHEQGALRAAETVPFFLAGVRVLVPFAHRLEDGVFIDLFTSLRDSRGEWHANPRPPFDIASHGQLAQAIDKFNSAVAGDWTETEVELFELAGGFTDAEVTADTMDIDEDQTAAPAPAPTQQEAQPQETRSPGLIARMLNQLIANQEAERSQAVVSEMAEDLEAMELDEDEDDGE